MSDVSSVSNYFATANEGFATTLGSTITSGAATVPLAGVSGLVNGTVFVGIIEPGATNQQVFTGIVNTSLSQITSVVWTRGTNVSHNGGVSIVDYTSGTLINMMSAGILKQHNQDGTHNAAAAASIAALLAAHAVPATALPAGAPVRLGLNLKTTTGSLLTTSYVTQCTVTATTAAGVEVEIEYKANITDGTSGAARTGHIRVQCDGVTISGSDITYHTSGNGAGAYPTMCINHTPGAGSHTWTLQAEADSASATLLDQASLEVKTIA